MLLFQSVNNRKMEAIYRDINTLLMFPIYCIRI